MLLSCEAVHSAVPRRKTIGQPVEIVDCASNHRGKQGRESYTIYQEGFVVNNLQFHIAGACWRTYCIPARCAFDLEGNLSIDLHSQTANAGHRNDLYPATQTA